MKLEVSYWRKVFVPIAVIAAVWPCSARAAETLGGHRMFREEQAARLGLTRAWFTQVQMNGARNHVERAVLEGDRLTILTTACVSQQLNALTGQTYWVAPIGNEKYPSLGPSANDKYVALINGSTLFVLDRKDGKPVMIRPVGGAPGAAPAVAEKWVFVPLVSGRIEGYPINLKKRSVWYYQSFGRAMVAPLVTPESVVWTTDAGYLYVGSSEEPAMRFRLETGSDIVAPPAYRKPFVYVASMSGNVFALHEVTGAQQWKYASGFPITRSPAAVGERVFVTSEEPALHCIDASSGSGLWEAPHMVQFAAASKDRVYGVSDLGALVVLDAATGAVLGQVAGDNSASSLVNDQTDRIYLVSDNGLVECFHELAAKKPLYHNPKQTGPEKKTTPLTKPSAPANAKSAPANSTAPAKPKATPAAEKPTKGNENKPEKKGDFGVEGNPFDQ